MAAAIVLVLAVDTFLSGLLLRHVLVLHHVVRDSTERVEALAGEVQVQEHDFAENVRRVVEGCSKVAEG